MMSIKHLFLKPKDDSFIEDRTDVDKNSNTAFIYNPYFNHSIDNQRQKLPVFNSRNHILYLIEKHQVLIIVGETGSGKSTQIPQYLIEAGWGADGIVGITEPRRVACTSLATRVAEERSVILGGEVGYSIRFDDCTTQDTKIKYMTEGLMIREMMADPLLRQYCAIMLDEVHERTLYTDIVLGLLKKILKKRKDLRLIVASATVDADHLQKYFNFNKTNDPSNDSSVALSIKGRNFPVDIFYLKDPCPDYVKSSVETVLKIHKTNDPGDILIFLTGVEEVDTCVELLNEQASHFQTHQDELLVLPMHGALPNHEQLKVFQSAPLKTRKVVVATNIAETSVTISGIVHVIDCGFVKLRWYNAEDNTDALVVVPTSRASATQRAGRAGRTRSGKVYRLYKEEEFKNLSEVTPPEMVRTEMSSAVISLMALGIDNMLRFDFPSPPPARHLTNALDILFALKAIDDSGSLKEPVGQQMAEFPLSPLFTKVLIESGEYGCSSEILSIIAMLQVQNIFMTPPGKTAQAKLQHQKFHVTEGDLITLLNVYTAFENCNYNNWCFDHFLNQKALLRAKDIRRNIEKLLVKFDIPIKSCDGATDVICKCITAGMFPNAAYLHHSGVYKTVRGNQNLHIHPSSILYTQTQPQWVLFCEILHTSRVYMRDLIVIEPNWLLEIAPHFYEKTIDR